MKKFKNILFSIFTLTLFLSIGSTVSAKTHNEMEPNNTMDEAEEIFCNRQTPSEVISGNSNNSYVISGYADNADEDWYKVYLSSNLDTYFSLSYGNPMYFTIYTATGLAIANESLVSTGKDSYGVFDLKFLPSGYYYIKVRGYSTSERSYKFTIGNPIYRYDNRTIAGTSITLSSVNTQVAQNYEISDIPRGSMINKVTISNVLSTTASKIDLAYSNSSTRFSKTLNFATFDIPLNAGYSRDGRYTLTYFYKNATKTFTPSVTFYYVYPILP